MRVRSCRGWQRQRWCVQKQRRRGCADSGARVCSREAALTHEHKQHHVTDWMLPRVTTVVTYARAFAIIHWTLVQVKQRDKMGVLVAMHQR